MRYLASELKIKVTRFGIRRQNEWPTYRASSIEYFRQIWIARLLRFVNFQVFLHVEVQK